MADVRYTPSNSGMVELGRSRAVQDASMSAARSIARTAAQIAPKTGYDVAPANVTGGWKNDLRAGASVTDDGTSSQGARKRSLLTAVEREKR